MNKKAKKIIIGSLIGVVVLYFGLGIIGTLVATEGFINVRNCDPDLLEQDFYRVQKCRADYESLKDREVVTFPCGKETLTGYLYENPSPKGVIVFSHGVKNLADANMSQVQDYYVSHGYTVFSFDMTGCGRSTGKGIRTLYESTNCVVNAVNKVKELDKTKELPIFLIGHSWGAYGAVTASSKVDGVKAVASFSAYNTPSELMYGSVEAKTSKAMILTKPAFELGLFLHWGAKVHQSAESAIKNNPNIPYVIIHGTEDKTVPYKTYSLYDNIVNDHYENVTAIKLEGIHHGTPWKTLEAETLTGEYEKGLSDLRKEHKGKLPDEIKEQYIASIDLDKSSAVNTELLEKIDTVFDSFVIK